MSKTVWAETKAHMQKYGWKKGATVRGTSGCLLYHLGRVVVEEEDRSLLSYRQAIKVVIGEPWISIAFWNDAPERTIEDVYALLDQLDAAERNTS